MSHQDQTSAINTYIAKVTEQFNSGHAIEHAYRPALQALMSAFDDTVAVNDPKHSEHGAPDFVFLKKSNTKIIKGYAEAKDIGVSLDKTEKLPQMKRYHGYANIFLTDYLGFRFFRNGAKYKSVSLGKVVNGKLEFDTSEIAQLANELEAFLQLPPEQIKSGKRLAEIMGGKARRIRDNVEAYLEHDQNEQNQEIESIYNMIKTMLVHDLTKQNFADMYAQTLVYGLFVARYNDDTPENFDRREAPYLVPKSNPFLRKFFDHIAGESFDTRLAYIVDELCQAFSVSNVKEIVHKHLKVADDTKDTKDPIIHFYEDFLQEYDPKERKKMGAYYTPIPVVQFIVRQVDKILKDEFGIVDGLASSETIEYEVEVGQDMRTDRRARKQTTQMLVLPKVQILDPAVGTATFLNETIKHIHKSFAGQEGRWSSYVKENLMKRLHGFELMMAPYTIAHLKLGMTLQETGVKDLTERLGVYLTNTLEEGIPAQQNLFHIGLAQAVSEESRQAAEIKSGRPIMVVMGNPPYSGVSSNETAYANALINKYKVEPGGKQKLQERKHWLNDDYVKFIAFAEDMIAKNGSGVVAMITNNGFLDNPTFRGMRWQLRQTFDKIYVLDLHGNAKKKEVAPDGSKDENVFDIMQGVSIMLAVKTDDKTESPAEVYHADIYGKRAAKFSVLNQGIKFAQIKPDSKNEYFVPKDTRGQAEYEKGADVDALFVVSSTGIFTLGDNFITSELRKSIKDRVEKVIDRQYSTQSINAGFSLGKNYAKWVTSHTDYSDFNDKLIQKYTYRPFDEKYTYFGAIGKNVEVFS